MPHVVEFQYSRDFLPYRLSGYYNTAQIGHSRIWLPYEIVEVAALAQHYGVLTRLLDWTFDLNVAIYFAVVKAMKIYMKEPEKIDRFVLWALNYGELSRGLLRGCAESKLRFIIPNYANNPNLSAQKGLHSYIEAATESDFPNPLNSNYAKINRERLDEYINKTFPNGKTTVLYKFSFPISESVEAFDKILRLNYTAARIYPGYAGTAKAMDEIELYKAIKRRNEVTDYETQI